MWWYVVGGTMLSLNALSGAVWHHNNVDDPNPGVYLYAAFWTFYVFDYFVWERVQLYTFDLIHEHIGFKLWWGGLVAYGWLFIVPLWGMAPHSDPGFSTPMTYFWLIGVSVLFLVGWTIGRGANLQKYTFKRWPGPQVPGDLRTRVHRGRRAQDPVQRMVGVRPATSTTWARGSWPSRSPWCSATPATSGPGPTPVFVVSFFTVRQRFDERECENKYGPEKWAEYQAPGQVPDLPRRLLTGSRGGPMRRPAFCAPLRRAETGGGWR